MQQVWTSRARAAIAVSIVTLCCAPASPARAADGAVPASATLGAGQTLAPGEARTSADGHYSLVMQPDGDLVAYADSEGAPHRAIWASESHGDGLHATLREDGDLVVAGADGTPVWRSASAGHEGARLVVQDDGNVVLYDGQDPIWATGQIGTRLHRGETLSAGQFVSSPTLRHRLVMQPDGNLVEYANGRRALWATGTDGHPGARVTMQPDGNLVVYDADGTPLWASDTVGSAGEFLMPGDDGNLVMYTVAAQPVWASGVLDSELAAGETLPAGQTLSSPDGRFRLSMQSDGNLVLYDGQDAIWQTDTGAGDARLTLRRDGNLVVAARRHQVLWSTASNGKHGARVAVQSDGNVVIYRADDTPVWASGVPGRQHTQPTSGAAAGISASSCSSSPGAGDLVTRWTPVVSCVLGLLRQPVTAEYVGAVQAVISCESGGDPRSRNDWDVNAQNGIPSQGLVQVIPPTFAAHRSPLLAQDIYDPAANIYAGLHYAIGRYGSILRIPTVATGRCQGY